MEEQEKRFKILKVEKYNEQIEEEKRKIIFDSVVLGILATSMIVDLAIPSSNKHPVLELVDAFSLAVGGGISIYWLKELISSIVKKTILTINVDEINSELDMLLKNEESKGMKR